jgi:hypothetical protein
VTASKLSFISMEIGYQHEDWLLDRSSRESGGQRGAGLPRFARGAVNMAGCPSAAPGVKRGNFQLRLLRTLIYPKRQKSAGVFNSPRRQRYCSLTLPLSDGPLAPMAC